MTSSRYAVGTGGRGGISRGIGITFITIALFLFAFTTLIGNFFYAEMGLGYLCDKKPNKWMLIGLRAIATVVVFGGSLMEFSVAWSTADVIMGFLALINLPVIIILGGPAIRCMKDYMRQKREGKNPVSGQKTSDSGRRPTSGTDRSGFTAFYKYPGILPHSASGSLLRTRSGFRNWSSARPDLRRSSAGISSPAHSACSRRSG